MTASPTRSQAGRSTASRLAVAVCLLATVTWTAPALGDPEPKEPVPPPRSSPEAAPPAKPPSGAAGATSPIAADVSSARDLFKQAAQLSREERWEEARELLKRSLALRPAPITHFSLAVAQHKTGELVESMENLRAFLAAPAEPETEKFREVARQTVADLERRVARVRVTIAPAGMSGLELRIDDVVVPVAAHDLPRLVNPGAHAVQVVADGYRPASAGFEVGEGESTDVSLSLIPLPDAPLGDAPVDGPASERGFPVLPVVLMAAGGAIAGAGLALGLVGLGEATDAPTRDGEEADAARTKGLVGDVLIGVGGATAALGVVLLVIHFVADDEAREDSVGSLRPWTDGSAAGLALSF